MPHVGPRGAGPLPGSWPCLGAHPVDRLHAVSPERTSPPTNHHDARTSTCGPHPGSPPRAQAHRCACRCRSDLLARPPLSGRSARPPTPAQPYRPPTPDATTHPAQSCLDRNQPTQRSPPHRIHDPRRRDRWPPQQIVDESPREAGAGARASPRPCAVSVSRLCQQPLLSMLPFGIVVLQNSAIRIASPRFALVRFALVRFALVRFAPFRLAPVRFAPFRFA